MTFRLSYGAEGYALIEPGSGQGPLTVDFKALQRRVARGGRELLARAVGARPGLRVVDCTAGLGSDAFILASRGCEVRLIERSNTLFLMLDDALDRAREDPQIEPIVSRMTLLRGDARHWLFHMRTQPPAVITIDPMFPPRAKSARVKGELQQLQRLLGTDESVLPLISLACSVATERVVVKRPLRGGEIDGLRPTGSVTGKASRFDIYPPLA